jgi:hypothetical protein
MTRFDDALNEAESIKSVQRFTWMVDMDFASGHVRVHDGLGELSYGGNTFTGIGIAGGISRLVDDLDTIARPLELLLTGLSSSIVATARDEIYQGRAIIVYAAWLNESWQLVANPQVWWSGFMNYMVLDATPAGGSIKLTSDHELNFGASSLLATNESLRMRNASEAGAEFQKDIQGFKSSWGEAPTTFASPIGDGWEFGGFGR